jgi:Raf kinase inhibitor-like YbhB/YbcL family protein
MLPAMKAFATCIVAFGLVGCGDDGASPPVDSSPVDDGQMMTIDTPQTDGPLGLFTLTSATITNGGVIPLTHVCTSQGGMNLSPALEWTNVPTGTMSFAVVFTDIFVPAQPFLHSVIYDIPASATGLPADVEKAYAPTDVPGAHQTLGYNNATRGYLGPCPQNGTHTYEFAVYALPTATLTGATMSPSLASANTMSKANNLGVAKLTGTHISL